MADNVGAIIEHGPADWQIFQQDAQGFATITVGGRWVIDAKGQVELRLVAEDTGVAVSHELDWHPAETRPDHTWSATLRAPAGGLYRLETRFHQADNPAGEWNPRGDMRHFLGVGDLWVIAGQSNSAGYGRGPYNDPPELGVHLFRNSEQWALASHPLNESTDTRHPCNREGANSGHSPYIHFGRLLKQNLGHPIGLVQTSLGGSPLCMWNPAEPGDPILYNNMIHCIELVGGRVKGVLWYQGESETGDEKTAATAADRFINAVGAWRSALKNPELAVITVQLNRLLMSQDEKADRLWAIVRETQRQVPRRLKGVTVVPALDLSLSDGVHTSPAGNILLGERMARSALGAFYGKPIDYLAPDIQSAEAAAGRKTVELLFAPVTSRMDIIDLTGNPFRVEDEAGIVPIEKMVYAGNKVLLVLKRALSGRTVVHGGFGANPAAVPMDMERFIPMLGFYNVPVAQGA